MQPIPNPDWTRWIVSSLAMHFRDNIGDTDFYLEGETRPSTVTDFGEMRFSGPYYNPINRNLWRIDILLAILIQSVQDDNDIYKLHRLTGIFLKAFHTDIKIRKFGDDSSELGCLTLSQRIRIIQFGQLQAATRVTQSSIETNYQMFLARSLEDGAD